MIVRLRKAMSYRIIGGKFRSSGKPQDVLCYIDAVKKIGLRT